ncbi:cytochrome P450 [Amycolatopsis aidingensis]|uniref:cytochrome P450 n=1 Tax=Amycolatopsis aidingensis TaxID=2842453 RepID=UPI001C0CA4D4|nr:cytochrome P450 [Amycolatopsis aidingensis]
MSENESSAPGSTAFPSVPGGVGALLGAEHRVDPYPLYRRWREHAPAARAAEGLLVASGHAECTQILRNPRFGHPEPEYLGDTADPRELLDDQGRVVRAFLNLNPPDHTRLRRLVSTAFTPRMVDQLTPRIEQITSELVRHLVEADEANLIDVLAQPLPIIVISELLGVPAADREQFAQWSRAMANAIDPAFLLPPEVREPAAQARHEFITYFRDVAAHRRRQPGEDLVSALVAVSDAGDTLTENELLVTLTMLLVAGHETTTNLIGNAVLALLRHPDQHRALAADPTLAEQAVEETLRHDPPVQLTLRTALEDTTVGSIPAPAGTRVLVLIGAANRDPAVCPDPDSFDIIRTTTRHLTFGHGIHFCLGVPLARLEARIALKELTQQAPTLRMTTQPQWKNSVTLRGLTDLPVAPH